MTIRLFIILFLIQYQLTLWGQDNVDPPVLERVTVLNDAGHVGVEWSFPSTQNIDGFIVYWKDPTKYPDPGTPFDTLYNASATTVIDLSGLADISTVYYSVAAFAIVGNEFRKSPQTEPHATIFNEVTFDSCQQQNILVWNEYLGWPDDDITYRIYANSNEISSTPDTFFYHENIDYNTSYNYYIIAQDNSGRTAASNRTSILTNYPEPPEYINADYATVTANNSIEVSFTMPVVSNSISYHLIRTNLNNGIVDTLDTFPGGQDNITLVDSEANIQNQYRYTLISINSCSLVSTESNTASNIVLAGTNQNNIVRLSWSSYENWLGGLSQYEIYRDIGDGYQKIGETQTTSFLDNTNNFDLENETGSILYYIIAQEGFGNPYGIQGESESNVIQIILDLQIEFPTAFTPNGDGQNDYFRPVNLQFIPQTYNLVIFDRWGMPVFKTTNINQPWNGTNANGKPAMEGVYNYQVEFNTADGKKHVQSGYVTVLYP